MSKTTLKGFLNLILLFSLLFFVSQSFSQNRTADSKNLWLKAIKKNASTIGSLYEIDIKELQNILKAAPNRSSFKGRSDIIIQLPNLNGEMEKYRVKEASVMAPGLQAKYPEIRSYVGYGIDSPTSRLRFSLSPYKGLSGIVISGEENKTIIIEPKKGDVSQIEIFKRSDRKKGDNAFLCNTTGELESTIKSSTSLGQFSSANGTLHTFDLALSVTGEYTAYHGGTKASANAAMVATITRVNGVFESDFNVTLVLIPGNDAIVYTSANTDPYSPVSTGQNYHSSYGGSPWFAVNWQVELQDDVLTTVIGEANYDIGHLFGHAGGGGNAGCIGCVCDSAAHNGGKGSGYTSPADGIPEGDTFDIDYVAHELGHQFGANHTFSHQSEGSGIAQIEPGSGSTIMGYAGITGATNVQQNSDPYFHAISIQQVTAHVASRTCDDETATGNNVPVANAGSNYTLPIGTPFILSGSATDLDGGDVLTYCWEQYDERNGQGGGFPSATGTNNNNPLFRSYSPSSSSERTFPKMSDLIASGVNGTLWEKIPTVARSADFRLTVRDNRNLGGASDFADMSVNWVTAAGPFTVSSQNTNSVWQQGSIQTITWDVASTNAAPVNAANVDILLSTDGGLTYPTVLATAVTNDGSHNILVPNGESANCRIMVKGSGNIFFNINTAVINISGSVAPTISYATTFGNIIEGSDCDYTDILVPLTIGQGPSESALVTFAIPAGDASIGVDYDILTPTVTFDQGITDSQDLRLRIYNDSFAETDETITIDFSVSPNGGNAVVGSNSYTFIITNDDFDPLSSGAISTIFSDDFESGLSNWTVSGNGTSNFAITNNAGFPDAGFFNSNQSNTTNYAFVNDDSCNCNMDAERIASIGIALTGGKEYTISFDYAFDNQYVGDTARLELSSDGGATWLIASNLPITATGTGSTAASTVPFTTTSFSYTPGANETTNFSFLYGDEGGWAQGLIIDNFVITSEVGYLAVQTAENTMTPNSINLQAIGSAYAFDAISGDLILNYNNINGFDYGCIDANVVREGLGAQEYNGSISPAFVTEKSFTITPTNTTTNTVTELTFYFTEAEISGWEGTTLLSRNNLFAKREGSNDIVPVTVSAYGSDVALTGLFTGVSGVYYFGPEDAFRTAVAPKVYLQGALLNSTGGLMRDDIRTMISTTSPYDATICNASVFTVTGNDAIVDWVQVELRDANNNTTVVVSQSALLQRDGDVVNTNGISSLIFNVPSANYYVAIKHRNHLGIMTANPILLRNSNVATVDFTDVTNQITFGSNAQTASGMPVNIVAMWAGNVNGDDIVQYSGTTPDSPSILSEVINDLGNFLGLPTYIVNGYNVHDINMDGKTQYTGTEPDTPFVLQNVIDHPENFLNFYTYQIEEQLPEN
ncbi:reprolysin-like metallopeptidase [Lacinutrix jangbogonensis]|uniref:reprolysin-like metallopeptidase n=1 Tax=Lacinutrix jangbogonensis TaxID=1469557 RepID=UPI00068CD458|nr:M12 family metallo-peptidase [Lacinutrix jangbogonensis]